MYLGQKDLETCMREDILEKHVSAYREVIRMFLHEDGRHCEDGIDIPFGAAPIGSVFAQSIQE